MTEIQTDLSHSPYFDDYDPTKQFYKILFVPKRAVQVREMNQLQTMIQQQITRFGNHVFKDGSVVDGCNITHIPRLSYVRLNQFDDPINTDFSTDTLKDFLVVSRTTGLRAAIVIANPGYLGTYPNTNVFYINYLNKGRDIADNQVAEFQSNEILDVYNKTQDKLGTLNPGNLYGTITTLNPGIDQETTGYTYGLFVGDGIVYQKGYFVNVYPHTILVKPFDTDVNNMMVGFVTDEEIINFYVDPSLIDPADTSNRNGIGADRLKLSPRLISVDKTQLSSIELEEFFPIVEFGVENQAIKQNVDPAYARLGDVIAKRTYEESGDYYIKPFITGTKQAANTENFIYRIDPGIGYVKGNRVELVGTLEIEVPRATTEGSRNGNLITANYGQYVIIDELSGTFGAKTAVTVDLYNGAQQSITNNTGTGGGLVGNKVGTAKIRAVMWENGTKSTANCTYRAYVAEIKMDSGKSFTNDVKSLYVSSGNNSVGFAAKADLVLTDGKVSILESGNGSLLFPVGVNGTKTIRNPQGGNDTEFTFRDSASATLQSNGSVTFTLNSPYAGGIERFFSSEGVLSSANKLKIDITSTSNMANSSASIVAGSVLNLDSSTVTVLSNTQFKVDLGYSLTSGTPQTVIATYPVVRNEAVQKRKQLSTGVYVRIDCSTAGTTGPFNLGITDVMKIRGVWVGNDYSESNPERSSWFMFDSGQDPLKYDHANLIVSPQFRNNLTTASRILVKLDVFVANTAGGIGFYTVDSYPVRFPGDVANTSNISFDDIPNVSGTNLRNVIDFRPQKINTATLTTTIGSSTVNPVSTSTYIGDSSGTYLVEPDSTIRNDLQYYLPRIDLIQANKDGIFNVKSSIAEEKPKTPLVDQDAMAIATSYVAPYPGITSDIKNLYDSSKPRITTRITGNRGYTMKDIYSLDRRITNLEYYQSLTMLEQQARDYKVIDENGLDRFKNGIFVDPLKNHALSDVSNFEHTVAIDELNEIARPRIAKNSVDLDVENSSNVTLSGHVASIAYDREEYINQPYASKFRNVTESVWKWSGNVYLFPNYDHFRNENVMPEVNIEIDVGTKIEDFAEPPFSQDFGDWRVGPTWQMWTSTGDIFVGTGHNFFDIGGGFASGR